MRPGIPHDSRLPPTWSWWVWVTRAPVSVMPSAWAASTIASISQAGSTTTHSRAQAGTYRPATPPILRFAADRNPDVVVFSQVRNIANPTAADHAAFIESAVAHFHTERGVPIENIILAGQSCGGWGSLYAAAYRYPTIGGVLAFAPTCHGKLPHP